MLLALNLLHRSQFLNTDIFPFLFFSELLTFLMIIFLNLKRMMTKIRVIANEYPAKHAEGDLYSHVCRH